MMGLSNVARQIIWLQLMMGLSNVVRQIIWLQQDGAPPQYAVTIVNLHLMNSLRIGHSAVIGYPARSSDLTCLNHYQWESIKGLWPM